LLSDPGEAHQAIPVAIRRFPNPDPRGLPRLRLRGHPDLILDTCSVRAKRGGDLSGPNPTGRGKRGTKYHIAVDGDGVPVACIPTAANVYDTLVFERLFLAAFAVVARIRAVFSDKGYDAKDHREMCHTFGVLSHKSVWAGGWPGPRPGWGVAGLDHHGDEMQELEIQCWCPGLPPQTWAAAVNAESGLRIGGTRPSTDIRTGLLHAPYFEPAVSAGDDGLAAVQNAKRRLLTWKPTGSSEAQSPPCTINTLGR
jgi:Transposase DDE domain